MNRAAAGQQAPAGWKAMEDFAAGIDGNRLPRSDRLAGTSLRITEGAGGDLVLDFRSACEVSWRRGDSAGTDWYEHVAVRPDLHYLTMTSGAEPLRADVIVVHAGTGQTLRIRARIGEQPTPGRPRVSQAFVPGVVAGSRAAGQPPRPSRDLIGWRALYRYSRGHLYEHVYLSSERYAWQCLVGEQRGHGDVDLASTWKLADSLYVFTFREFRIPVAATWLYDLTAMRTTGTFFGLGSDGAVRCAPGGALITELGRVTYPDEQPV